MLFYLLPVGVSTVVFFTCADRGFQRFEQAVQARGNVKRLGNH